MLTVLGEATIKVDDFGYKEVEIDLRRRGEAALFIKYTKGDEAYLALEPVARNPLLGDSTEWAMLVAKTPNPVEFDPLTYKFSGGEEGQFALPVCWRGTRLVLRFTFSGLVAGQTEGTLIVGALPNSLR